MFYLVYKIRGMFDLLQRIFIIPEFLNTMT